jgi:hypothetical protein
VRAPTKRTCPEGHQYYKSMDCPTCPICEKANRPGEGLLSALGAPARRAFERAGIRSCTELSRHSEKEILELHGVGPSTIPTLRAYLRAAGLSFRKTEGAKLASKGVRK